MIRIFALALLALLAWCPTGFAVTGYQFDVIVLSELTQKGLDSEAWPEINPAALDITGAMDINTQNLNPNIQRVAKEDSLLNKEMARIKRYSRYKVLLHLVWRESLAALDKPSVLHLYGGNLYDMSGNIIGRSRNENVAYNDQQIWSLNGTLTIRLRRYFDLAFNLIFAEPTRLILAKAPDLKDKLVESQLQYFELKQTRRTRSKELNYIDHPLYGILFKITPVDITTPLPVIPAKAGI